MNDYGTGNTIAPTSSLGGEQLDNYQSDVQRKFSQLKADQFGVVGQVMECLPNTMFRVEVTESQVPQLVGETILFTLAGKMRLNRIRVLPGDKVIGYVTKYNIRMGKITFRLK